MEFSLGERREVVFNSYTGNLAVGETVEFYDGDDRVRVEVEGVDDYMGNVIRAIGRIVGQKEVIMSAGLFSCDDGDGFAVFKTKRGNEQEAS